MIFDNPPSWLHDVIRAIPELPDISRLSKEHAEMGVHLPWAFYIEHKLLSMGLPSQLFMDVLITKFPSLLPADLSGFTRYDFGELLPQQFTKDYFVTPFNYAPPFMSIAVVEPDLLPTFHASYVPWAKSSTFCLLQYFIVLPSSFKSYLQI